MDITPFIDNLPFGKSTNEFTTPDASGSTSQATNIIEALEAVSARDGKGGTLVCSVFFSQTFANIELFFPRPCSNR